MRLHVSDDGRRFVAPDGTPFFWLADTAWNVALRGDTPDWERYLDVRRRQGFTVIQFVCSPWRGCRSPRHGRIFEQAFGTVRYDERAFEKMSEWISMIVEHDMTPAPVLLWDNNPDDPFFDWSEETCIDAGRRMVERWSRYDPVWILAGDGDYRSARRVDRWKRIGREVFAGTTLPATMHPCGCTWVGDLFASEPWYSFVGIQSGHGSVDHDLGFLLAGPYATRWTEIEKPFINMEPNYETAYSFGERVLFTDYHVRRAAYWSLFGAPIAGLTYGNNDIWVWAQQANERAEGHDDIWVAGHWEAGLETPGIESLGVMMRILRRIGWSRLFPAGHLLSDQPGWTDPNKFIGCAASLDLSTVVAYLPKGGEIGFVGDVVRNGGRSYWVDPVTGAWADAGVFGDRAAFAPDERDWLFVVESSDVGQSKSVRAENT